MPARSIPVVVLSLTPAVLCLGGCDPIDAASSPLMVTITATATVTAVPGAAQPRATDVASSLYEWGGGSDGTGVFSVGIHPRDGMAAAIPPGSYIVKLAPGAQSGSWMLCDTALCGPAFQENATVVGNPLGEWSSAMYIGPKSRTLWVDNVILSRDDRAG